MLFFKCEKMFSFNAINAFDALAYVVIKCSICNVNYADNE